MSVYKYALSLYWLILCVRVFVCGITNMWNPGLHICQSVCFIVISCTHVHIVSAVGRIVERSWVFVCVCVFVHARAGSLQPKSRPAWHPFCWSEGIWSGACCQPGPCITFKEVSVGPSPYHSSGPPPPPWLVEAPLGMPGTLGLICVCVFSKMHFEVPSVCVCVFLKAHFQSVLCVSIRFCN